MQTGSTKCNCVSSYHGLAESKPHRICATSVILSLSAVVTTGPAEMGIHHTAEYSSPELLYKLRLRKTTLNIDMCANDVWSLGCLLALALTGHKLFGYSSHQGTPPAYQHRLDQACSSQRPWVCSCPWLLLLCVCEWS